MYVPRGGVYQFWQGIYVCAQEFLQSSVFQYLAYYLVLMPEAFQHFLAGDVLSCLCLLCLGVEFQYIEEYFSHLTRRGDVEPLPCQLVYLLLQLCHLLCEVSACFCKSRFVYAHTCLLHACQHAHQWHFHVLEDIPKPRLVQLLLEEFFQFLQCCLAVRLLQVVKSVPHFRMQQVVCYGGIEETLLPYPTCL